MGSDWNRRSGVTDHYADSNYNLIQDIKLKLVTAPTLSLVTTDEAKNYSKLSSDTTDDDLVDYLVSAAHGVLERELGGVALVEQTWRQYQQGGCETIELMREPVIGVPTVSYYSSFDTTTATNITYSSHFRVVENELYHANGYFTEGRAGDGYTVDYVVGMFTASNYTSSNDPALNVFKTAILRTFDWLYNQREEHVTKIDEGDWSVSYAGELPMGIKRLVMPYHSGKSLI